MPMSIGFGYMAFYATVVGGGLMGDSDHLLSSTNEFIGALEVTRRQKYFGNVILILFFGFWLERNASIFRVIVKMKSSWVGVSYLSSFTVAFRLLSRGSVCSL